MDVTLTWGLGDWMEDEVSFEFPRRWRATVEIKDLLSSDGSRENAVRVGAEIARRLRNQLPDDLKDGPVIREIIEDFESVDEAGDRFACAAFNDVLNELYDWADERRVWLGLK